MHADLMEVSGTLTYIQRVIIIYGAQTTSKAKVFWLAVKQLVACDCVYRMKEMSGNPPLPLHM